MFKKLNNVPIRLASALLLLVLLCGLTVPAFATEDATTQIDSSAADETYDVVSTASDEGEGAEGETGEETDDTDDERYTISLRDYTDGYTVDISGPVFTFIEGTGIADVVESTGEYLIAAGETIKFTVEAPNGYQITNVGYWEIKEDGTEVNYIENIWDNFGEYTLQMPEYDIGLAAAVAPEDSFIMYNNNIGGASETDYWMYLAQLSNHYFPSSTEAYANVQIDERFFTSEYSDEMTFIAELRAYEPDVGYWVVGEQEYTFEELSGLEYTTKTISTKSEDNITVRIYKGFEFKVDDDKANRMQVGREVYPVIKVSHTNWRDVKGELDYRWDYAPIWAPIYEEGAYVPEEIAWLYNLDEDTRKGAIIREILADLGIEVGTINNDNLGQNIGYLAGWEGYDALEDTYDPNDYDIEYMLLCNFVDAKMDELLERMSEENASVSLKSVPTAWTASKTFSELFEIMAEESEAFKAVVELDGLIYDASTLLAELEEDSTRGEDAETLRAAIKAANSKLLMEDVPSGEEAEPEYFYEAYDALLEVYLTIADKVFLEGELEIVVSEQADGLYSLTARLVGNDAATFDITWYNKDTSKTITNVDGSILYKVRADIVGSGDYYGEASARLYLPTKPVISVTSSTYSIYVNVEAVETTLNMPEIEGYIVEVYNEDELVADVVSETAGTIEVNGLEKLTEYSVVVWAYNAVGDGDISKDTISTENSSSSSSGYSTTYYTLTFDTNGGSSISSISKVKNATIDLSDYIPTKEGYDFAGWYSDEELTEAVTSVKLTANTAVYAGWTEQEPNEPVVENPFADVDESVYFYDAVLWAVENEITNGVTDTTFGPELSCTRAQMATFLWRAAGSPTPTVSTTPFTGVDSSAYYYEAVLWAVEEGITNGTSAATFSPDASCTRAQMVAFLWRFMDCPEPTSGTNPFTDVDSNAYYYEAVLWAVENGVTNGTGTTTFSPDAGCTRGQMVTFLYRLLG